LNDWGKPWEKEQEERKAKRRTILYIVLIPIAIAALFGLIMLVKILFFPAHVTNKAIDTAYGVVDEVMDKNNAIYNYEWFKEQEAYIRQCLKNEEIAKEEWESYKSDLPADREKWTRDDKTEEASLRNSYYALQKLTNKAMEDYNAKASMVTRNIFKDNLPSNIDRALYAGKNLTE
jgi:hypothetical protein